MVRATFSNLLAQCCNSEHNQKHIAGVRWNPFHQASFITHADLLCAQHCSAHSPQQAVWVGQAIPRQGQHLQGILTKGTQKTEMFRFDAWARV